MENNESEEWRSIDGYEGLYEVSNLGRVRSLDKLVIFGSGSVKFMKGRVLKPTKDGGGYLKVTLSKDGKQTTFKLQTLVAKTFDEICGEYNDGLEIDHIDTNPLNNCAVNLRWCTHKDNINNPLTLQHKSDSRKGDKCCWYGKFGKEHPGSKPVIQCNLNGTKLAEFDCIHEAERKLGISASKVCACCRGRRKTAGGYRWAYKEQSCSLI